MSELQVGFLRTKRVRLIKQVEIAECGLAAIAMVSNFHGGVLDLATLRRRFTLSARGASLRTLIDVADQLDLSARALQVPLDKLDKIRFPAVLHWDDDHFVVVEAARKGKVLIHNPASSSRWLSNDEVSRHFTGVALELQPTANFRATTTERRLKMTQLWSRAVGLKRSVLQILILSLVLEAIILVSPLYMQTAIDYVVPVQDSNLMLVISIGFALVTLINIAASFTRSFSVLAAGASLGTGIGANVARHLFRLPIAWFHKRQVGDILTRFQSIAPIRALLTEGAPSALLDGVFAIFIIAVMFFYSPVLSFSAIIALSLYCVSRASLFRIQRAAEEDAIVNSGKEQTLLIETLRGIATLRLFSREAVRLAQWQGRYIDSTNSRIAVSRVSIWQNSISSFIFGAETIFATWYGINLVIAGGFSIGMVFAFLAYKGQFSRRVIALVDNGIALKMLGLHLERLSDIALTEEDVSFQTASAPRVEYSGCLELRDVMFRYSDADPRVLNGVNLKVNVGDHIAITGASGGGKSTLVKILLGLLEPESGEILVDNIPLRQFGHKNFHDQISAVMQDDHLFGGNLFDNIALFDEEPDRDRVIQASKAAGIHHEIESMPMGYNSLVGDMGSALSGGQKQRVLLARALYRSPRLLVMDEGTSHLDADKEREINKTITEMGITRIIIAHRIETIRSASTILHMNNGLLSDVTERYRDQAARVGSVFGV